MGRLSSLEALERLEPAELDLDRSPAHRDIVELLRERADLLGDEDRILLKMYLDADSSFHQLAKVVGTDRSTLCRRIHRMIRRLSDGTYDVCQRDERQFSPVEMNIIRDHFIRGLSVRRICRQYGLGCYRTRTIVEKARKLVRSAAAV